MKMPRNTNSKSLSYPKELREILSDATSEDIYRAYILVYNLERAGCLNKFRSLFLYYNVDVYQLLSEKELKIIKEIMERIVICQYGGLQKNINSLSEIQMQKTTETTSNYDFDDKTQSNELQKKEENTTKDSETKESDAALLDDDFFKTIQNA